MLDMAEERPMLADIVKLLIERLTKRRKEFDFTVELRLRERPFLTFNVKGWSIRRPVEEATAE